MGSRKPGPTSSNPATPFPGSTTPGPLGKSDYADPSLWLQPGVCRPVGNTPGPLGKNDLADPTLLQQMEAFLASLAASSPAAIAASQVAHNSGQVTFDAEGNDNSSSPYFSRVVHWPGNALSGVTLGRGYDMGDRTEAAVTADLMAAGIPAAKAKEFAKGAGKKGNDAKKFVKDNKTALGEISREAQQKLFDNIYPVYVERARSNYNKWTKDEGGAALAGKVEWDNLDPAIRDILVDFVYQGFTKGPNPMVKGMRNDFDELIEYIENTPALSQYEPGRKRVEYLKKHKK